MTKRGRPRKSKKLEQYTISELRDMPLASMAKLFFNDILGKGSVVTTSPKSTQLVAQVKKDESGIKREDSVVSDLMGMTLEKKADYLAESLMGYLKKSK